jgi:hypothetical protein
MPNVMESQVRHFKHLAWHQFVPKEALISLHDLERQPYGPLSYPESRKGQIQIADFVLK